MYIVSIYLNIVIDLYRAKDEHIQRSGLSGQSLNCEMWGAYCSVAEDASFLWHGAVLLGYCPAFQRIVKPSSSGPCSPGRYFKRPEVCIQLLLTHFRMCPHFSLCFITCRHNNKATFLLRIWLFLWYKILLEKLVVTQLLTKSLPCMEQKGASGCIKNSVILQEKAQLIKTLEVYKEVHVVNYQCCYWTKSLTY
jgi:hypothetical protein